MNIGGVATRSIWLYEDGWSVGIFDQTKLPYALERLRLTTCVHAAIAIETMQTRGAPLIGMCAAYGICLALRESTDTEALMQAYTRLKRTRPTAVNLQWALDAMVAAVAPLPPEQRVVAAYARAAALCEEDVAVCRAIGEQGLHILRNIWVKKKQNPVNILMHCNPGWLACVDWGTAMAGIYLAHQEGVPVHVWVDETRPRLQGALTAFELKEQGVPYTILPDNAAGHAIGRHLVDIVLVGADRVTRGGDVANKIGTLQKALAAFVHGVPFYVALPSSTIDWTLHDGRKEIPIEERSPSEVEWVSGVDALGNLATVRLFPEGSSFFNPGFDVTPASLVTGLITERGVCVATEEGLLGLYPERRAENNRPSQ